MPQATTLQRAIFGAVIGVVALFLSAAHAQDAPEDFPSVMACMQAAKPVLQRRQLDLLNARYDLGDHPARGVTIARTKPVEDFMEFEQRAAYFDGDIVFATNKGVSILDRGSQVHFMAEFQELLEFPPAPKLNVFGKLDPKQASEAELRGEALFSGKAQCATCHTAPYCTDNLILELKLNADEKSDLVAFLRVL